LERLRRGNLEDKEGQDESCVGAKAEEEDEVYSGSSSTESVVLEGAPEEGP